MQNTTEERMEELRPPSVLPPHLLLASILGILGGRILLPLSPVLTMQLVNYGYLLGTLLLVSGLYLTIQGSRQFARAGTNILPFTPASSLVTDGVFRFSRNPMYTGMVLVLIGLALLTNHLWSWLGVVVFTLIIRYRFIAREEELMLATFPEEFAGYRQQVRRWV